jgi:hypothetical protein
VYINAVAKQRNDTLAGRYFGEIALRQRFGYGLKSCHRSQTSIGGQGLSSALTGGRPAFDFFFFIKKN